jgi:hypothetical protein
MGTLTQRKYIDVNGLRSGVSVSLSWLNDISTTSLQVIYTLVLTFQEVKEPAPPARVRLPLITFQV